MTALEVEARAFAGRLSDLLNGTVCNGIHLSSVATEPGRVNVGYNLTRIDPSGRYDATRTPPWRSCENWARCSGGRIS